MADRFPTLEDFTDDHTESRSNESLRIDASNADDDFLKREQAVLGADAAQFASVGDNLSTTVDDGQDDLLGGEEGYGGGHTGREEITEFESSFPSIDTRNEHVAPGGFITGSGVPTQSQPAYSNYSAPEDEPDVIKQWRERRDEGLHRRAEASAAKKAETIKAAQASIDEFYTLYHSKIDKGKDQTRKDAQAFLDNRQDTSAGGTSWERIAKLVDLSGKGTKGGANGTGKERFRELLTTLKKDEHAPGAAGV
ncbi:hypothetical protein MMC13_001763 [Lambiella insularis]|nr:hypothetical protein [Lambiella insularis]